LLVVLVFLSVFSKISFQSRIVPHHLLPKDSEGDLSVFAGAKIRTFFTLAKLFESFFENFRKTVVFQNHRSHPCEQIVFFSPHPTDSHGQIFRRWTAKIRQDFELPNIFGVFLLIFFSGRHGGMTEYIGMGWIR